MPRELTTHDSHPHWSPLVKAALWRVPGMVAVWGLFGVVVGVLAAPGSGPIALAAGITAGLIVMVPFGILLALGGGKWKDSLVGGLLGLVVAPMLARVAPTPGVQVVPFAIVTGGIVGATVVTAFYRIPRLVFGLFRSSPATHPAAEEAVAA